MQQPSRIFNPGMLRYVEGDATIPRGGSHRLLIHIVNDLGGWGSGFVVAISKRWKKPEQEYRIWYRSQGEGQLKFQLGEIQNVEIQTDLTVVNMLAQHGIGLDKDGNPPLRLDALKSCLEKVAKEAKDRSSSVHLPRIGAGLASGKTSGYDKEVWSKIEALLKETLINKGINVTVYDLPGENK
jgi:O-acetyl-ADP-ribose deacetylase (regulator of RNase III)